MTFIVRLVLDETGLLNGLVVRVRNGEKQRFSKVDEIGPLIARMVADEEGHHITGGNS
jgi:hypothetical protein